jgi:hypothetical protein
MKLSELTTSDQLVMALARQGYGVVTPIEKPQNPAAGIYALHEYACECCGQQNRVVTIIPPEHMEEGDAGLCAVLDKDDSIGHWHFWECWAGTTPKLDPATVELDRIGPAVNACFDLEGEQG